MLDTLPAPLLATLVLLWLVQTLATLATSTLARLVGDRAAPWMTGWVGVPLHELSHLLACLLTWRRVREVQFFSPDASTGSLGRVVWEPGRGPFAWLAALLVGLAPLAGGTLALQGLARLGAWSTQQQPPTFAAISLSTWGNGLLDWARVAQNVTLASWHGDGWHRFAMLAGWFATVSVATHLTPSRADLQGTWRGILVVSAASALLLITANALSLPVLAPLATVLGLACAWLAPGLILAAFALTIVWLFATLACRVCGRP